MKKILISLYFILMILAALKSEANCTVSVEVVGAIGAGSFDLIQRAHKQAIKQNCESVLLKVNTPGGSLQSTRLIVELILDSKIPFICLITPEGGHAGSAGAILLQACHVSSGLPVTNIGAATPILGGGAETPKDLRQKMINDTVSWLEGITKLRGRNLQFSKDIVTEAKSTTSEEAVRLKALDFMSKDLGDFLRQSSQKEISVKDQKVKLSAVPEIIDFKSDLRNEILSFTSNPEFAYLIFMGSLALLYAELTHPGLIVPGVVGGIGLVVSLVAFHQLNVEWGGVGLIFLGLVLLFAEMFVPSFGALGVGGIISLFLGSLFLFDAENSGYTLPLSVILPTILTLGLILLGLGSLFYKGLKRKNPTADQELQRQLAQVVHLEKDQKSGQILVGGDHWRFQSDVVLNLNDEVKILKRNGLTLVVEPKK